MLNYAREVFAKMEGSSDISDPLHTLTPGTRSRFQLVRRNRLFEFGYHTDLYRANKGESLFTKVTTVRPLYIVVNYTQSTVLFAQESAKGSPLFVKPSQQMPFHWNEKDNEKKVCVRIIPSKTDSDCSTDFDWSIGFTLSDAGTITLHNR